MPRRRMDRRSILAGVVSGAIALSLGTTRAAQTPRGPAKKSTPGNALDITVMDGMFLMPSQVVSGTVAITLVNTGSAPHSAQLLRHKEGVLLPDITNALRHGGMAEMAPLVAFAGGPGHVGQGMEQTVIQELAAGTYAVICTAVGEEGIPHAVASLPHRLEVVEGGATIDEPAATGEVRLVDFAFEGLPAELPAGRQILKVSSDGSEPHELGIRRLDDGVAADMMIDTILLGGKGVPEPAAASGALQVLANLPMSPAGGIQVMEPGMSGHLVVDLDPGSYVAVSLVPSLANAGTSQAMLGMIQGFTVGAP